MWLRKYEHKNVAVVKRYVSLLQHLIKVRFNVETSYFFLSFPSIRPYFTIFLHIVVRLIPSKAAARVI